MTWARSVERLRGRLTAARMRSTATPRVTVDLDGRVPAWALRLLCALVATGCTALVASHEAHWWIAGALIAAIVARPAGAAPALLAAGAGVLVLASPGAPFPARTFLLVAGLALVVQLAALVGDLPWQTSVETRVLWGAARPFLAIQALAQAAALLGAWLTGQELTDSQLPVLAGVALAVLAWALLLRLRADSGRS